MLTKPDFIDKYRAAEPDVEIADINKAWDQYIAAEERKAEAEERRLQAEAEERRFQAEAKAEAIAAKAEALRAAEASAREQAAAVATQLDDARELLAQSGARLRAAEDMARRKIGAAVRTWRQRRDGGEAAIGIATRPMGDIDVWAPLEQAAEVEEQEELNVKR